MSPEKKRWCKCMVGLYLNAVGSYIYQVGSNLFPNSSNFFPNSSICQHFAEWHTYENYGKFFTFCVYKLLIMKELFIKLDPTWSKSNPTWIKSTVFRYNVQIACLIQIIFTHHVEVCSLIPVGGRWWRWGVCGHHCHHPHSSQGSHALGRPPGCHGSATQYNS